MAEGWVLHPGGGLTRFSEDSGAARHERGRALRVRQGLPGLVGCLGVWFDTALRGLQAGSPRTGGARRAAGSSGGASGRGGRVRLDRWLLLGPGRGRRDGG